MQTGIQPRGALAQVLSGQLQSVPPYPKLLTNLESAYLHGTGHVHCTGLGPGSSIGIRMGIGVGVGIGIGISEEFEADGVGSATTHYAVQQGDGGIIEHQVTGRGPAHQSVSRAEDQTPTGVKATPNDQHELAGFGSNRRRIEPRADRPGWCRPHRGDDTALAQADLPQLILGPHPLTVHGERSVGLKPKSNGQISHHSIVAHTQRGG